MTFENKTLIAIAIEGLFEPEQNAKFAWKYYSAGKNQHVLLYGVEKRQENDAEQALLYSIQIRSPIPQDLCSAGGCFGRKPAT